MSGWVAGAIAGSVLIGSYSASESSKAQQKGITAGMNAEERIAQRNLAFQEEQADQQRLDFQPWRDSGQKALDRIWQGVDSGEFVMGQASDFDFKVDPAYDFRLQQGVEALDKSASARGRLNSGAQQKALLEYGQGMASNEYANAYAREEATRAKKFNILSGLNQQGQTSAAGQAGASSQLAQSSGNILSNLGRGMNISNQQVGSARADGYTDQARVFNQAAQNWITYDGLKNKKGANG